MGWATDGCWGRGIVRNPQSTDDLLVHVSQLVLSCFRGELWLLKIGQPVGPALELLELIDQPLLPVLAIRM
jgi:hypothetical protein